jgi:hypothetical protein
LGFIKINAVLLLVGLALDWIILKLHAVWKIYRKAQLPQGIFSCRTSAMPNSRLLLAWLLPAKRVSWAFSPRPFGGCKPPPLQEKSALGSPHSNQNATSQITVTTRDCRRHRGPLDYQHPYASMRRYAELLALKYQKMKGNEHFSEKALSRG